MSTIPIDDKLVIGPDRANIDARYKASNNRPYTSVAAAEAAINLVIGNVGLTVLVADENDPDYPKAKEYWVQPKGTTPETYGLVEKGAGTTDYADLDNKPTISDGGQGSAQIPLSGNVKVTATAATSGQTTGVAVTAENGEITMAFTLEKGADGQNGATPTINQSNKHWEIDGSDTGVLAEGHNPNRGTYNVGDTFPSDGIAGDYIVVVDDSQSTPTAEIYKWDVTQNDWEQTGVSPNDAAFEDGQLLPNTKIDDTVLKNPASNSLSKATDIMPIAAKLKGVTATETKVTLQENENFFDNYYINPSTNKVATASSGTPKNGVLCVSVEGVKSVRFLGFQKASTSKAGTAYGFATQQLTSENISDFTLSVSKEYNNGAETDSAKEYIVQVPEGMSYFICTIRKSNNYAMKLEDFYCYLQSGESVVDLCATIHEESIFVEDNDPMLGRFRKVSNKYTYFTNQINGQTYDNDFKTGKVDIRSYRGGVLRIKGGSLASSIIITNANASRSNNTDLSLAEGWSDEKIISSNTEYEIEIPNDAYSLLYLALIGDSNREKYDSTPTFIKLVKKVSELTNIPSQIKELEKRVNTKFGEVDVTEEDVTFEMKYGEYIAGGDGAITEKSGNSYAEIDCTGFERISFIGILAKNSATSGYAFYDENDDCVMSSVFYNDASIAASTTKKYVIEVPENATTFRTSVKCGFSALNEKNFLMWKVAGQYLDEYIKRFVEKDNRILVTLPLGDYLMDDNAISNDSSSNSRGKWYNGSGHIHIPAKEGVKFRISKGYSTVRYAFLTTLNNVPGESPVYCDNRKYPIEFNGDEPIDIVTPFGANWLYIERGNNREPKYIGVYLDEFVYREMMSRVDTTGTIKTTPLDFPQEVRYTKIGTKSTVPTFKANYYAQEVEGEKRMLTEEPNDWSSNYKNYYIRSYVELPAAKQILNALKKAEQLANLEYAPKHNIPTKNGFISEGVERKSVPYTSNMDDGKTVGIEVGIHTFMTAINNPYSLIYTEKVLGSDSRSAWGKTYHSANGYAYYGTVCCGLTSSVYGADQKYNNNVMGYSWRDFGKYLPLGRRGEVDFDLIRVGDIANDPGHSFMIYSIERDSYGDVLNVEIIESTSSATASSTLNGDGGVRIVKRTKDEFLNYITDTTTHDAPYTLYRYKDAYKNTKYEPSEYVPLVNRGEQETTISYNNEICTYAGDKACFALGDLVVLNYNLNNDVNFVGTSIDIYKDDDNTPYLSFTLEEANNSYTNYRENRTNGYTTIDQINHVLVLDTTILQAKKGVDNLPAGKYKACINGSTNFTYWEVVNTNCTVYKANGGYVLAFAKEPLIVYSALVNGRIGDMRFIASDKEKRDKKVRIYPFEWKMLNLLKNSVYNPQIRVAVQGDYGIAVGPVVNLESE